LDVSVGVFGGDDCDIVFDLSSIPVGLPLCCNNYGFRWR